MLLPPSAASRPRLERWLRLQVRGSPALAWDHHGGENDTTPRRRRVLCGMRLPGAAFPRPPCCSLASLLPVPALEVLDFTFSNKAHIPCQVVYEALGDTEMNRLRPGPQQLTVNRNVSSWAVSPEREAGFVVCFKYYFQHRLSLSQRSNGTNSFFKSQ